jgi:Flp pilus assembly protein TadD
LNGRSGREYRDNVAVNLYDRWMTAKGLLASGDAHAASIVLESIRDAEPRKGSVREALGRAYFISGRHTLAEQEFAVLLEIDPANDYAHYALARCAMQRGDNHRARAHLKLARAMNPGNAEYAKAYQRLESISPPGTAGS